MDTKLIRDLFGAALPVVAVDSQSVEELNALEQIYFEVGKRLKMPVFCFDLAAGLRQIVPAQEVRYRFEDGSEFEGEPVSSGDGVWSSDPNEDSTAERLVEDRSEVAGIDFKPLETKFQHPLLNIFQFIDNYPKKGIFVLIDVHQFIDGEKTIHESKRYLKHLALKLKESHKRIVLLGQGINLGQDYSGLVYEIHNYLPGLPEISEAINLAINDMDNEMQLASKRFSIALNADDRDAIFNACRGLTLEEALNALRIDMRARKRVDNQTAQSITSFKISKLEKLGIKFSPAPDVAPGGVQEFKAWVKQRRRLFHASVNAQPTRLKLPTPKGCLIVGPSGTGKTLLAKALGHDWGIPILQVDFGSFYSSLVGETEANFRRFIRLVEHLGPVVLLFDEIEKALGAIANGGSSTDSGVSQRLFGSFLTWLNDKTSACFVVATANNIEGLPPEFKRKGRFDEIWFVDTPNASERAEILTIHLAKHGSDLGDRELEALVSNTSDFVGAELRQVIDEAAILAAEEGLDEIRFEHVRAAISTTIPLASSQRDTLTNLRAWASTAARNASPKEIELETSTAPSGRRGRPAMLHEDDD